MTFARKPYTRTRVLPTPIPLAQRRAASMARADGASAPAPKEIAIRSESYRRAVAALPCKSCGIQGYSQAAHPNHGKSKGAKADDTACFALCCDRPGVKECHARFDQYELGGRHAQALIEQAWGADTRRQIAAMGLWPADLPQPKEKP